MYLVYTVVHCVHCVPWVHSVLVIIHINVAFTAKINTDFENRDLRLVVVEKGTLKILLFWSYIDP